jgi:hypothetical protein
MYREPRSAKSVFQQIKGLDTNFNSAPGSLKPTRPDICTTSVSSSVFQLSDSGVEKCIENLSIQKLFFSAK